MAIVPINNDNTNIVAARTSSTNSNRANNFNNSAAFSEMFSNIINNANNAGNTSSVTGGNGFGGGNTLTSGDPELDAMFEAAGRQYNINPNLLKAVAQVESNFRVDAVSSAGAQGIMQIMPPTARHLGVTDPFDPLQSIMGGARYLREQLDRFNGNIQLALAAYNAGWPAVQRHGGIPPFPQTQAYVPRVLELFGNGNVTAGMPPQGGVGMPGMNNHHCPTCAAQSGQQGNNASNQFNMNEMMQQMATMMMMNMQMGMGSSGSGSRNSFF